MENKNNELDLGELSEYAKSLYENNLSVEEMKNALLRQGATEEQAIQILQEVDNKTKVEKSKRAVCFLNGGIGLLVVGVCMSVDSYCSAGPGEVYTIYVKTMLAGFASLLYALIDIYASKEKRI